MELDVLVIGGGVTGLGVAWDLALRGMRVAVAEMGGVVTGTSGRYHGLLHTGARYAVSDGNSAAECWREHQILRRVAPMAVDDTGGLFVLTPADDEGFVPQWLASCARVGIPTKRLGPDEARRREPALSPAVREAYAVPDAACDSFALGSALEAGIVAQGGRVLSYHRAVALHRAGDRVVGARLRDLRADAELDVAAAVTVVAAGPWAAQVAGLGGVRYQMQLSRGAMIGFNGRWTRSIINRLHWPGDGDIFIPLGAHGVAGTTSVPTDDPFDARIEPWERERIVGEICAVLPAIRHATVLREWAGVRPLFDPATQASSETGEHVDGRKAARTFEVLDHAARDGVAGLISIVGGKLTTYRLMAERAADAVCRALGVERPCATATTPLEGRARV
ncbi:MAG TPA: FAD-dependent oxidoreductase [Chloroflexaceae bacterium]|nr:FAD-dependent oxidoreductase [Chloroflexaceae bacterium]